MELFSNILAKACCDDFKHPQYDQAVYFIPSLVHNHIEIEILKFTKDTKNYLPFKFYEVIS